MRAEYIDKDHPDLPEDFAVFDAYSFSEYFAKTIDAMESSSKVQMVVWENAGDVFSKIEQNGIQSLTPVMHGSDITAMDTAYCANLSLEQGLQEYFNGFTRHSGLYEEMQDAQKGCAAISAFWNSAVAAIGEHAEVSVFHRSDKFSALKETDGMHSGDTNSPLWLRFLRTYKGAGTIGVPECDVIRSHSRNGHKLKPGVERLWMLKEFSLALLPHNNNHGIVHAWPHLGLDHDLTRTQTNRHVEIVDIATKTPILPMY